MHPYLEGTAWRETALFVTAKMTKPLRSSPEALVAKEGEFNSPGTGDAASHGDNPSPLPKRANGYNEVWIC